MTAYFAVKFVHVIGAAVLLGTGASIAFFMLMAHRTKSASAIAHTASIVVIADFVFTASAVVVQPLSGLALAYLGSFSLNEPWILISIGLYLFTGAFWVPVVFMQMRMRDLARDAAEKSEPLPAEYHRLFRTWFIFGFPAFFAVLGIFWMMIAKPFV
jgi:uncharacterized membrane protein